MVLDFLITCVAYLLYPLCLIIRKARFTEKKINKLARRNSICVCLLFFALHIVLDDGNIPNLAAATVWYFVIKAILHKWCLIDTEMPKEDIVRDLVDIEEHKAHEPIKERPIKVGQNTCTKPRKSKRRNRSVGLKITTIILSVLVVILAGIGIWQYSQITDYKKQIAKLENEPMNYVVEQNNEEYLTYWTINHERLDFYERYIVFVVEGYGDFYFTYDQMLDVTKDDETYTFWAYNKELAIDLGYEEYVPEVRY